MWCFSFHRRVHLAVVINQSINQPTMQPIFYFRYKPIEIKTVKKEKGKITDRQKLTDNN